MNNYENIIPLDKLSTFLADTVDCHVCPAYNESIDCVRRCRKQLKEWLTKEVEE